MSHTRWIDRVVTGEGRTIDWAVGTQIEQRQTK